MHSIQTYLILLTAAIPVLLFYFLGFTTTMPSLAVVRAANSAFAPRHIPVALFVGGTSGIGQAMAEAFARYTKGNAHIIIIGRNRASAERIIASFPKPTIQRTTDQPAAPLHEFVQCDATLMKNVHATTTELLSRLPKINFLVMSPGIFTMKGRDETEEGIDKKLAVHYYARWKFTRDLLPALRKAKEADEDAKVFSVLGPGFGGEIDLDDLGLKKTYSVTNAGLTAPTYNDLMLEEFSAQEPGIVFTHASPGVVRTSLARSSDSLLVRWMSPLLYGLIYPFSVSQDVCAEHMLFSLFDGKKGFNRRDSKGEDIATKRYFGSEEARKRLWEHTVEATRVGGA